MMHDATRKPVPQTERAWSRELNGIRDFIQRARKELGGPNDRWARNMIAFYQARVQHLLDNRPGPRLKPPRKRRSRRGTKSRH